MRDPFNNEPLIINVRTLQASRSLDITDREIDAAYIVKFWSKLGAIFHDPRRHLVTRADGTHVEGKSKTDATRACTSCGSLVADEAPWMPRINVRVNRTGDAHEKMLSRCFECHNGKGTPPELFSEWLESLPAEAREMREKRQRLLYEHRRHSKNESERRAAAARKAKKARETR